ncbi:unnamed protein product, partial [Darwinula stevensoni]
MKSATTVDAENLLSLKTDILEYYLAPILPRECGRSVPKRLKRSVGGTPSIIGGWPWQAAIYDVKRGDIICGGALIHEEWVLTATLCLTIDGTSRARNRDDLIVYLGKHYRNNSLDDEFVQQKQVSSIILHEHSNVWNYDSDIALIRLTKPAILTDRVQIVCLPTGFDLSQQNLENGKQGWVAGWGHDASDILSEELTEVEIPVLSNRKCRNDTIHFTGDPSTTRTLTLNNFCAGYGLETSFE